MLFQTGTHTHRIGDGDGVNAVEAGVRQTLPEPGEVGIGIARRPMTAGEVVRPAQIGRHWLVDGDDAETAVQTAAPRRAVPREVARGPRFRRRRRRRRRRAIAWTCSVRPRRAVARPVPSPPSRWSASASPPAPPGRASPGTRRSPRRRRPRGACRRAGDRPVPRRRSVRDQPARRGRARGRRSTAARRHSRRCRSPVPTHRRPRPARSRSARPARRSRNRRGV